MKMNWRVWILGALLLTVVALTEQSVSAQQAAGKEMDVPASKSRLYAVPLSSAKNARQGSLMRGYHQSDGVPFVLTHRVMVKSGGSVKIPLNQHVRKLYLAGFTGTWDNGEPVWGNPNGWRHIIFIGDRMGTLALDYADGHTVRYPLIYGYSAWWYAPLEQAPEPFASSKAARRVLHHALALRPTGFGAASAYMGVIVPLPGKIKDIRIEDNPKKAGVPIISGITAEITGPPPSNWLRLPYNRPTAAEARWINTHPLEPNADRLPAVQAALRHLRGLLYTTPRDFPSHLPISVPTDYRGPRVRFRGSVYADILTSVFYNDVQDILNKIGRNGIYHTSTPGAPEWLYTGIGTWRKHAGAYARMSWGRDLGRSLQEITELGFLKRANRVADYCFREARLWTQESSLIYKGAQIWPPGFGAWKIATLKIGAYAGTRIWQPSLDLREPSLPSQGVQLPSHWCRIINIPSPALGTGVFENDAQGLIMLFTYKLWQRQPHPNTWMHKHWKDILAAGNWIGWQLDHPAISGSDDGVLQTDSECAGGIGHAKYADVLCEQALRAYAAMAASIGQTAVATRWQATADRLFQAIEKVYFTKGRWGPTWTLVPAGWPNRSTNMGPLITMADRRGFAPHDNIPGWHIRDLNAYRRLVSSYHPFGFYGTAMGYGQGFVTQAALLLDRMRDATTMLNWFAKTIYYPGYKPYITPEGCQVQRHGLYWHRTGDLGNGVQEGETVKTLRLVIGVDDSHPGHSQLIPRLPIGWTEIHIGNYPLLTTADNGRRVLRHISYDLQRHGNKLTLVFKSAKPVAMMSVRLGPFANSTIRAEVDGHSVASARLRVRQSGDSYWVWLPTMRAVTRFRAEVWGQFPTLGNGRSGHW